MRYPVRKVYITQEWGVNPQIYSRFGFKGHNGIDLRIYNNDGVKASTGDLLAPHKGTIKEKAFDADGYGWYYKIENDVEGSILAHNSELPLKVGDNVIEGQVIGKTGNTGWSTAPHVHWGYYRFPRDRNNGYGGTINQVPLLEGQQGENMVEVESAKFEELVKKATEYDKFVEAGYNNVNGINDVVSGLEDEVGRLEVDKNYLQEQVRAAEFEKNKLAEQLEECQKNSSGSPVDIQEKVEVAGKNWLINGVIVDSDGKVSANYKLKEG